jgi:ArsR family transcriptional regulator, arsenate/arsenite/antimonite-responsive transcriptional repressor / arsenate reductase (thioredoxin)
MNVHMDDLQVRLEERAAVFAALGDPVRLAIVDDLALSDRSPGELAQRHELSSNLLAHHLGVLSAAGLVSRVVSGGDARRRYVRLTTEVSDLAELLIGPRRQAPGELLFLCTHNSARSQLAAAIWTARSGHVAHSAGTHPAPAVHEMALQTARRHGYDLDGAIPQLLDPQALSRPDIQVVTVCDRVHEDVEPGPNWWHWSIPDPVESGAEEAFDAVVIEIEARITAAMTPTPTPTPTPTSNEAA